MPSAIEAIKRRLTELLAKDHDVPHCRRILAHEFHVSITTIKYHTDGAYRKWACEYYQERRSDPVFKEQQKERHQTWRRRNRLRINADQRRWYQNRKGDPVFMERYRAMKRARYHRMSIEERRASYQRKWSDPEYVERSRASKRAYYDRHKSDPEFRKRLRESARTSQRRRREKNSPRI